MTTGREWLEAYAAALGTEPPDEATVDQLLALSGVAAHASERVAAPISTWLAARAGVAPDQAHRLAGELAERLAQGAAGAGGV